MTGRRCRATFAHKALRTPVRCIKREGHSLPDHMARFRLPTKGLRYALLTWQLRRRKYKGYREGDLGDFPVWLQREEARG